MDNQIKKDWTQSERERFERIVCAIISRNNTTLSKEVIYWAKEMIFLLDNHYKQTSHEPNQ